jgi:hypothetical protein
MSLSGQSRFHLFRSSSAVDLLSVPGRLAGLLVRFSFLLVSLLAVGTLSAAAPPAAEKPGDLRFRRVYFPEGTNEWAKGGAKYLPVEAGEFERLINAVERTAPAAPGQSSVGLVEAQYDARLKGQNLLTGSARLDVSQSIPSGMLMTLDPCNLAISRAQWITSDGAPAVLGLTGDGKLQVVAERSGQMKFDWSLAGQRDSAGGENFTIGVPPSPVSHMRLELPAELTPVTDLGIVIDDGPADPGFRRWKIELGGRPGCRLRLAKARDEARPTTILASQLSTYDLSLRGLEVTATLNIEAHREPLRDVAVALDSSLDLIEVSVVDESPERQLSEKESLSWNVSPSHGGKVRQATISLPPSRRHGAVRLQLRAIAPLVVAAGWNLPRVSVHDVILRTNKIRLTVSAPLCLDQLQARGCLQTDVGTLAKSVGEQLDFEALGADAGVEVSVSQRAAEIRAVSATATVLGQGKMSSRVATDFRCGDGAVFALEADVLPNWTIDSVRSEPTDALDDWTLEYRGGARRLAIRLARPLTSSRPLRMIVSARRLYATPGRNLGVDDLVPLRFVAGVMYSWSAESKRWVDLRATGSNELHFTAGDRLRAADLTSLTAAELDLFADPPGDFLFRDDAGAADLRLSVENRRPTYSAAIRVEAVVADGLLAENYTFTCRPSKAAPIDRVVVHFTGHREGPLSWLAPGIDDSRFTARRWTAQQETSAGLTPDEENWDVTFRNPRSTVMEIRASRKSRLAGPTPVCLASLPDAARQEGALVVRNLGPQAVEMKTHRLTAQPTEAAATDQVQTVRGSYRYDPRTEGGPQSEAAMVLTAVESKSAAAWAWDCEVSSQLAVDGAADHVVTYRIQNTGSRGIHLALPAPLARRDVHGIWVNGKPAAVRENDPAANVLNVDLPAELKFITLVVQISSRGEPLGVCDRITPPLPDIGIPVFARRWQLELPPGYAVCGFAGILSDSASPFSVSRSLLGILGRSEGQSLFNPLRGEDWRSLLGSREPPRGYPAGGRESDRLSPCSVPGTLWVAPCFDLAGGDASVTVVRRAAVNAASWVLFLTLVGVGAWLFSNRPWVMLTLAVFLGIPALLLPAEISVIFAHGLLAILFCLLLSLVRQQTAAGKPAPAARGEMPSTLTNVFPFGAPVLAVAMLCGLNSAQAGETSTSAPLPYSVFIPVDSKQQPTHGKYFVPEPFFDELYHRAAAQAEKPQGWMIASAVYHAALADGATQSGHVVDRIAAEFEIHVFNAAARVRIPVRRDQVSLEPGQAKLDDRAVQPEWEPDGRALLLDIAEPGEYRLELALRPNAPVAGTGPAFGAALPAALHASRGVDVAIPRVPTSRLEFTVPAGGPQVEFPSALGEVRWEDVASHWTAELGPSDRLSIRWPDDSRTDETPAVEVEQLLWLKIEPGCVLLDVRIRAKSASGPLRRLLVHADSALELLPAVSRAAPSVQAFGGGDGSRTYEIQWPSTAGSAGACDLHFLWNGISSLGAFRVPPIDVLGSRPVRRSLAVSIDPGLEYFMPGSRLQETGAVPEFLANWGASETPPDLAYRLNGNAADWSLTTRTRRAETSCDQTVTWSFRANAADVQFHAQLTTVSGNVYQYRLEAPPRLQLDSLTVLSDGANRAARWSLGPDGRITVFLASPVRGRHDLLLHGQMPFPMKRKTALPPFRLEEVRLQTSLVHLYRRQDVLVEVSGDQGLADVKTTADDSGQGDRGRLLRSFFVDPAAASPVQVTVKANRPRVSARQVTRVACEDNRWRTACEFSLEVSEGLLDAIELDVPSSWKDGVKTSPAMVATFAANFDDRATLVLSPSASLSCDGAFSVSGPASAAAGFAVPDIRMKHVQSAGKCLVLPTSVERLRGESAVLPHSTERQPVGWALQKLRRSLPKDRVPYVLIGGQDIDPKDTLRYEVTGEPWRAVLLSPRKTSAATRVVKSDVNYAWQGDGGCLAAAFLDVEAGSAIDCPLELPEGFDLLQVIVDGVPVDAVRRPPASGGRAGSWSVPLAPLASASHVELLYFAKSLPDALRSGGRGHCSIRAPNLGDLPIDRTTWTVASPPGLQLMEQGAGSHPEGTRQGVSLLLPAPSSLLPALPAGDIANHWRKFVAEGGLVVSSAANGPADMLALDYRPDRPQPWIQQWAGIAGFLAAVGLAALLIRQGLVGNWFASRPGHLGVAIGLAWWLWLSPSALGLLIVAAVLFAQFHPWRRLPRLAWKDRAPGASAAPGSPASGPSSFA